MYSYVFLITSILDFNTSKSQKTELLLKQGVDFMKRGFCTVFVNEIM